MMAATRNAVWGVALACALSLSTGPVGVEAQGRRQRPPEVDPGGVSPAELQRLFDAYVLVQAQDTLKLDEAQYAKFLPRLRALQEVRRRSQTERARLVQDLRQLVQRGGDNGQIAERLKGLRELEARTFDEVRRAADDLDDVLEPVQRARLRIFQEQMERRQLDLLMRARQAARARGVR